MTNFIPCVSVYFSRMGSWRIPGSSAEEVRTVVSGHSALIHQADTAWTAISAQ